MARHTAHHQKARHWGGLGCLVVIGAQAAAGSRVTVVITVLLTRI
jgi:hypothetical protein